MQIDESFFSSGKATISSTKRSGEQGVKIMKHLSDVLMTLLMLLVITKSKAKACC